MVVMSKQNVPALRLEVFSGEWGECVLGSHSQVTTGSSDVQDAEPDGTYPFFVRSQQVERSNKYLFDGEAILIPGEGRLGEIFHYYDGKFDFHQRVYRISNFEGVDGKYVYWAMQHSFKEHALQNTVKATVDSLRQPTVREFSFSKPLTSAEQQAIGAVFTNLDAVINQHTKKHKALLQAKTALMQRMFPQEGQTVPELRLDGFSGEWESTIIDAVADVVGGGTPSTSNPFFWDGTIDWYSPNEIGSDVVAKPSKRRITVEGLRASSAQLLPAHRTILYTGRASIGHTAILDHPATTNQGFQSLVLRDGMDTYFIYSLTPLITEKALKISSGSTFLEISARELAGISIPIPPTLAEQQAIGAVFTQLDALIAAEAQYIESLKQAKTALLQRMFI